jgi:prolipoprotein diacylglyceryltransferase
MILFPILSISYTYPGIPSILCTSFSDSEELLLLLLLLLDEEEEEEDESELCFLFFFFFFFFLSFLRFFLSFFFFSDFSVGALLRTGAGGATCWTACSCFFWLCYILRSIFATYFPISS